MKKVKKILIIVQRSNGDVFMSLKLIKELYDFYLSPQIDLLVNDDTFEVAKLLPYVNNIHLFSYQKKQEKRFLQEKNLIKKIFKKYDLSINLTASDRSVIYSILASNNSISAIEKDNKKSWWKKKFLTHFYFFDFQSHILSNNLKPLELLKINYKISLPSISIEDQVSQNIKNKLFTLGIKKNFVIFHPSAQYKYKIYPQHLRDILLGLLSKLDTQIVVTGSKNLIDTQIKNQLPVLANVFDLIGETSLEEYLALSHLSLAYIGMDTLNMHLAASQNKRIFAIYGPTRLTMWSPWSNHSMKSAIYDSPSQTYSNITIFQSNMPCVACGKAGCDDKHGRSECLHDIDPSFIFNEISEWFKFKDLEVEMKI